MADEDVVQYGPFGSLRKRAALAPKTVGPGPNVRILRVGESQWPSEQLMPFQSQVAVPQQQPAALALRKPTQPTGYPSLRPDMEGNGGPSAGKAGGQMGGQYGPMSEANKSALGVASRVGLGAKLGAAALGLMGVAAPNPIGPMGIGLLGIKLSEALRNKLGISPAIGYVGPTEADFQSIRDTYGAFAEAQARSEAAAERSMGAQSPMVEYGGPTAAQTQSAAESAIAAGGAPTEGGYDWGNVPSAESFGEGWGMSPDPGAPAPSSMSIGEAAQAVGESGYGPSAESGWGGSMNSGPDTAGGGAGGTSGGTSDDGGHSSDAGGGMGGAGGADWGKGGVFKVNRPTRFRAGERGEETGIMIPKKMEAKGIQPRELMVLRGLLRALKKLGG